MVKLDELPPELHGAIARQLGGPDLADLRALSLVSRAFAAPAQIAMVEDIYLRTDRGVDAAIEWLSARPDLALRVRSLKCCERPSWPEPRALSQFQVLTLVELMPRLEGADICGFHPAGGHEVMIAVGAIGRPLRSLDLTVGVGEMAGPACTILGQSRMTLHTLRAWDWFSPGLSGVGEWPWCLPALRHVEYWSSRRQPGDVMRSVLRNAPNLRTVRAPLHGLRRLRDPVVAQMDSVTTCADWVTARGLALEIAHYKRLRFLTLDICTTNETAFKLLRFLPPSLIDLNLEGAYVELWRLFYLVQSGTWLPHLRRICLPRESVDCTAKWEAPELRWACARFGLECYAPTRD